MLQNCTCVKPYFKVYTIVDGKIAFHHMSARFIYKHIYSLSPKRVSHILLSQSYKHNIKTLSFTG